MPASPDPPPPMRQSRELRSEIIARRAAVDEGRRRAAADRLAEHLQALPEYRGARRVAAYLSRDDEIDTGRLLHVICADHGRCFVPVIADGHMEFRAWTPAAPTNRNRLGIREPLAGESCPARELDLVLAPLVAFDATGNRMGMGGGYYDRTFAFLRETRRGTRPGPLLVGLAYELQRVDALIARAWDVPLDGAITEQGWRDFRSIEEDP